MSSNTVTAILEKSWLQSAKWLFFIAVITITYLALAPIEQPPGSNDKVNHLVAFFGLSVLIDAGFPRRSFIGTKMLVLMAFGISIEIAQSFFPYRSSSLADWVADIVGLLIYCSGIPLLKKTYVLKARWTLNHHPLKDTDYGR